MSPLQNAGNLICDGEVPFRPSDWPQRLAGLAASFGRDRQLRYSRYLTPIDRDGCRCLYLHPELAHDNPALLQDVLDFATQNRLRLSASPCLMTPLGDKGDCGDECLDGR
jgi:hypothetical protein